LDILKKPDFSISSIILSQDGKKIFTGHYNSHIKKWNKKTGECLDIWKHHGGAIRFIFPLEKQKKIITAHFNHSVKVWNIKTGKFLQTFEDHNNGEICSIDKSQDGDKIFLGFSNGNIKILDIKTGKYSEALKGDSERVEALAILHEDEEVVSGSKSGTIRIWGSKK